MADTLVASIAPTSAPSSPNSGAGPKYNPDVTTLEDGLEEEHLETEEEDEDDEDSSGKSKIHKVVKEDDGEDEEDKEDKEDDEDSDEDDEEDKTEIPFNRPSLKEIKAEFPDLFKKFPELRESFFRELEFTKLFPSIEDAKEAFTENEAFSNLQESVLSGDPAPLLDSVEKTDKNAFELLSLSFLPSLYKKNPELYTQAVNPLLQNLVRSLYKSSDENTKNAGLVLAQFLFDDDGEGIAKGLKSIVKSLKPDEEQTKLKAKREEQLSTQFRTSVGHVEETIAKSLRAIVLKNPAFDPNKTFSKFLREQGATEIGRRISKQLQQDRGHMDVMASRWKRARANGFSSDDESKIVSTYLARAKSLIPDACAKVTAAMLGTRTKVEKPGKERKESFSGKASSSGNGASSKTEKVDYNKMSDMDILAS
jgi:hypothetical protein